MFMDIDGMKLRYSRMADEEQNHSLEDAMAKELDIIDRLLAHRGMPLHQRPMHAAIEFVELCILEVKDGKDPESKPPGKFTDFATERWFRIIHKIAVDWYREHFGDAMDAGRLEGTSAVVLVRDTPYLVKVPMTTTEAGKPGKTFWLCYHNGVLADEDVLAWIQSGPNFANLDPKDTKAAHSVTKDVSSKLRSIYTALMGVSAADKAVSELREGILPNLERAAHHLAKGDDENRKIAYWDMQMACELSLKCLAQQRSGAFRETHDLFLLYDNMPDGIPLFARTELSKLPNWEKMVDIRYGGGPPISVRNAFRSYQATLEIVKATTNSMKRMRLGKAKFELQKPPWMRAYDDDE